MIRLLYSSTARANLGKPEVAEIVAHASEKNEQKGITGALAYSGRNFCQLLEGDEGDVTELVEAIRNDTRHAGFKILDQKKITNRKFPNWSMEQVRDLDFSVVINAMND